jgi:hypothetical protein
MLKLSVSTSKDQIPGSLIYGEQMPGNQCFTSRVNVSEPVKLVVSIPAEIIHTGVFIVSLDEQPLSVDVDPNMNTSSICRTVEHANESLIVAEKTVCEHFHLDKLPIHRVKGDELKHEKSNQNAEQKRASVTHKKGNVEQNREQPVIATVIKVSANSIVTSLEEGNTSISTMNTSISNTSTGTTLTGNTSTNTSTGTTGNTSTGSTSTDTSMGTSNILRSLEEGSKGSKTLRLEEGSTTLRLEEGSTTPRLEEGSTTLRLEEGSTNALTNAQNGAYSTKSSPSKPPQLNAIKSDKESTTRKAYTKLPSKPRNNALQPSKKCHTHLGIIGTPREHKRQDISFRWVPPKIPLLRVQTRKMKRKILKLNKMITTTLMTLGKASEIPPKKLLLKQNKKNTQIEDAKEQNSLHSQYELLNRREIQQQPSTHPRGTHTNESAPRNNPLLNSTNGQNSLHFEYYQLKREEIQEKSTKHLQDTHTKILGPPKTPLLSNVEDLHLSEESIPTQVLYRNTTSEGEGRRHAEKALTEELQAPTSLLPKPQHSVDVRIQSKHHSTDLGTEKIDQIYSSEAQLAEEDNQETQDTKTNMKNELKLQQQKEKYIQDRKTTTALIHKQQLHQIPTPSYAIFLWKITSYCFKQWICLLIIKHYFLNYSSALALLLYKLPRNWNQNKQFI